MQLEAAFRRSLYLSLAIASLALCVSEVSYLPEMPIVGSLVGVLLIVAYRLEGRWSLTLNAANTVGMVLTTILGIWIAYQFYRPQSESLIYHLPWPTSLLPYLGPVLLVLIPVKLFRPKEIGDYWTMYGLGLMSMALGCAMAEDGFFGVLLVLWLVVFVWSLTLFYLYRESGLQPLLSMGNRPGAVQQAGRFPLLKRAGRWALGVLFVGFVCFAATPRLTSGQFTLRSKMETGITGESQIDLNKTGALSVNEELAFTITAEDAEGNPKLDLSPATRWRNISMSTYDAGRWLKDRSGTHLSLEPSMRALTHLEATPARRTPTASNRIARLPELGPRQYYLTIRPAPDQAPIPLLMDPIFWKRGALPPIVSMTNSDPETWLNWQQSHDTNFRPLAGAVAKAPVWCETRVDTEEPDLGPTMYLTSSIPRAYIDYSAATSVLEWTDKVVEKLIAEGTLPIQVRERGSGDIRRKLEHHEIIARALCNYLASSGEFEYTLDLRRKIRTIDPVEDFLYHVRAGHCQRFATALVFMLRSQGIPAQFVLGYKGCEEIAPGTYAIRQSHAHAWAEVLIPRPPLPDDPPPGKAHANPANVTHYHWLSLDPTPELTAEEGAVASGNWFEAAGQGTTAFFRNIILGFNNDLRDKVGKFIASFFSRAGDSILNGELSRELVILLAIAGIPVIAVLVRRYRRRVRKAPIADAEAEQLARVVPFHIRLMAILERAGFRPHPSQTAKEFATGVETELARQPLTRGVASVPRDAADIYYRVRFGNEALSPEEVRRLDASLDRLEACFQSTEMPVVG